MWMSKVFRMSHSSLSALGSLNSLTLKTERKVKNPTTVLFLCLKFRHHGVAYSTLESKYFSFFSWNQTNTIDSENTQPYQLLTAEFAHNRKTSLFVKFTSPWEDGLHAKVRWTQVVNFVLGTPSNIWGGKTIHRDQTNACNPSRSLTHSHTHAYETNAFFCVLSYFWKQFVWQKHSLFERKREFCLSVEVLLLLLLFLFFCGSLFQETRGFASSTSI